MDINILRIILSTINFVIFYFILKKFVFKKTIAVMDSRKSAIEASLNKVVEQEEKVKSLELQYVEDIKKYKSDGIKLVESYKLKADNVYKEIIEESKKEAEVIKAHAMKDIEREKIKARGEIKEEVIDLSIKIAEKVIKKEIDENKHRELIDEFIAKVGN